MDIDTDPFLWEFIDIVLESSYAVTCSSDLFKHIAKNADAFFTVSSDLFVPWKFVKHRSSSITTLRPVSGSELYRFYSHNELFTGLHQIATAYLEQEEEAGGYLDAKIHVRMKKYVRFMDKVHSTVDVNTLADMMEESSFFGNHQVE